METCTYIVAELLKAAEAGTFEPFIYYPESLDSLLSPNKNTILHIYLSTLSERSTDFIKEVLSICPPLLWKVNVHGDTPLHIAARYGHADAAEELIEQAKALDLESGEGPRESEMAAVRKMLRMTNKNKETALHEAARNERSLGVVEAIMKCLAYGGPNGKTALHEATVLDFEDDDFTNKTVPDFEDDDLTIKGLREQLWQKSSSGIKNDKDDAQSQIGPKEQLWKKFKSSLCIKNNKDDAQSQIGSKEQLWKKFKSLLCIKNDKDDAQSQIVAGSLHKMS
ncbi:hypothetical protein GH714_025308 [Hevea brasiliensis]|uniref:Uncharacterized protein n=1 Tax=Hevea brasiliensis TaxID=3981 RepID=A0A6A6MWT9_HEVBR|nr:hypothetical protein GH714_025308 [Hevea brasiliensis]